MQAMISGALLRRGLGLAAVVVLASAGPGFADRPVTNPPPTTSTEQQGTNDNGDLGAVAKGVTLTYPSGSPGSSSKRITSVDVSWTPPPCWIGPVMDPETFKKNVLAAVDATDVPGQPSYAMQAMDEYRRHYEEGYTWNGSGDGYKDFNVDQQGKGMFWGAVVNPESTDYHRFDCNSTIPFYVPNGELPPPEHPTSSRPRCSRSSPTPIPKCPASP